MRIPLFKRLIIAACNVFFPPLAVALLTGFTSTDTFLNSALFLLAIIPSHVHGFYIAIVYFTRKRRVRKGQSPGKPHKAGIWSEKVLTGGVGWSEADRLKQAHVTTGKHRRGSDVDVPRERRRSTRRSRREDLQRRDSRRSSQRRQPSMLIQEPDGVLQDPAMAGTNETRSSRY